VAPQSEYSRKSLCTEYAAASELPAEHNDTGTLIEIRRISFKATVAFLDCGDLSLRGTAWLSGFLSTPTVAFPGYKVLHKIAKIRYFSLNTATLAVKTT
jgi:hypothetical protein